jgi:hypothetical protein
MHTRMSRNSHRHVDDYVHGERFCCYLGTVISRETGKRGEAAGKLMGMDV